MVVEPDNSRPIDVTTTEGRLDFRDNTRINHPTFTHSFISPFSPLWHLRPAWCHLPTDLVPLLYPTWASLSSSSSASSSICSSLFSPQKGVPTLALSGPPSQPFQPPCPGRDWTASRSKTRAQFTTVVCTLVGWLFYAWSATYGVNAVATAPEFIPQQTTGDWPSITAPNENEKCLFSNIQGFLHNILVTCFNK